MYAAHGNKMDAYDGPSVTVICFRITIGMFSDEKENSIQIAPGRV